MVRVLPYIVSDFNILKMLTLEDSAIERGEESLENTLK